MVENGYAVQTETADADQAIRADMGPTKAAEAAGQTDAGTLVNSSAATDEGTDANSGDTGHALDVSSGTAGAVSGGDGTGASSAQATDEAAGDTGVTHEFSPPDRASPVATATTGVQPTSPVTADAVNNGSAVPSTASSTAKSGYPQFLEKLRHASAQPVVNEVRDFVTDFPQLGLTRLQQANRIHDFLASATQHLMATEVFADMLPDEAMAAEGLEKFVIIKLFKVLFRPGADARADELVSRRLQEHKEQSSADTALEKFSPESQEIFDRAVAEVRKVDQYRAPRDKVVCMLNAYHLVESVVEELRRVADSTDVSTGLDENVLRRVLKALVVEAAPPNFFSNLEFTAAFRQSKRLTREEKRCLRNLSAALEAATGVRLEAFGPGGCGGACEDLPLWLTNTGVTFRFENIDAGDLLIGEVGELLDECQQMAQVLRELVEPIPSLSSWE